jgi:hypothetical protein
MVIGERQVDTQPRASYCDTNPEDRYTNQSALWEWVRSDEHTNIAKDLPGLIDTFSATLQTDISIDIKELFG